MVILPRVRWTQARISTGYINWQFVLWTWGLWIPLWVSCCPPHTPARKWKISGASHMHSLVGSPWHARDCRTGEHWAARPCR
ncbi:hypothetical protein B0T20DRAFT_411859 [Sordaria brevicollis]|uniref:Uncharacterized protein n=1 Tax=Sordaria brevicollis TaxID=83679 RepID=A0AAE0UCS6_SORBR|nr:hypothetical protein B0T20DRAFT_411859 [Sordaria brevicollis]